MSNVNIIVNGFSYTGWTAFDINASVKDACRSFSLQLAEMDAQFWALEAGAACQVVCEYGLLVDGFIDDFAPSFAQSSHSIAISGRSKSCDFVDCAAIYKKGGFKDKDILEIAIALAEPFDVLIESDEDLKKIPKFQINQGETCFAAVERLAKQQGLLLIGTAEGGIDITRAKDKRHAGSLVEGVNIVSAGCTFSHANRFSEYIVKGQSKKNSKLKHKEEDKQIKRYRPTIIMAETDMDAKRCENRAKWNKDRAAGEGTRANVTVYGMADNGGKLYEPNHLIYVSSQSLKIEQDMLIEAVQFGKSMSGTLTQLTLVDPRAYGGEKQQTSKSGGGFG
ncbi:MAG: hypothetical protein HRU28_02535 [Rhizobiales bacterium]|nr:hypothetical protein [Hyphomicrobiales bacterium]